MSDDMDDELGNEKTKMMTGRAPKIYVGMGICVALVALYYVFSSPNTGDNQSAVVSVPTNLDSVQGKNPVSPDYAERLEDEDKRRAQEAEQTGGSAFPTPQAKEEVVDDSLSFEGLENLDFADLEDEPDIVLEDEDFDYIEESTNNGQQVLENEVSLVDLNRQALISAQMAGLITAKHRHSGLARIETFGFEEQKEEEGELSKIANQILPDPVETAQELEDQFVPPLPGTIYYGSLTSRATSDAPGPVLAKILEGPYKGGKLIGSFEVGNDTIIINFHTLTLPKKKSSYSVNAVAIETQNLGIALDGDVDRHLGLKLGTLFISSMVEGYAELNKASGATEIRNQNTDETTTSNREYTKKDLAINAAGNVGKEANRIFKDVYGSIPTTVSIPGDTPIGILFL